MRVLERPTPTVDFTIIQEVANSLQTDVDSIFEIQGTDLETAFYELEEDNVLVVLFTTPPKPQPNLRGCAKRPF